MSVFKLLLNNKWLSLSALLILLQPIGLADAQKPLFREKHAGAKNLEIPLDFVRSARVVENMIFGFPNRTLVVAFRKPMRVVSTLEGERAGISFVGNHYTPPPCWSLTHEIGFEKCRERIYREMGLSRKNTCFLFTGADMQNLSIGSSSFGDMAVHALVTAGVRTNAIRSSRDEGRYVEPGTINIILMANRRLTPRAMARAIISATEAKTAALQDLDVRSGSNPVHWQATGTGTDEVMVVEGRGSRIDNAGGHCKLGELIAVAVHEAVTDAVYRQNGLSNRRSVLQRLQEREIDLHQIIREFSPDGERERRYVAGLEEILLQRRFASFMESAFALSDAYESGLLGSLDGFESWCRKVAEEIAGDKMDKWTDRIESEKIPIVLRMSLNALLNGLVSRDRHSAGLDLPLRSRSAFRMAAEEKRLNAQARSSWHTGRYGKDS